jgi:DNA-binding NarL/FixJ family response regulator
MSRGKLAILPYKPKAAFTLDSRLFVAIHGSRTGKRDLTDIFVRPLSPQKEEIMINFDQAEVSPREQQVLNLLVQGCSNKEIGGQLHIGPGTVKQYLRMLFLRAGIREGRKRVKLARSAHEDESAVMTPCPGLSPRENQISILVWEGLTNREIGKIVGTSEQVVKNHLRRAFDKLGVWTRLELAMYVASHGGKDRLTKNQAGNSLGTLERSTPILPSLTFHL